MVAFSVEIEIGDPAGERWETVEALVDTGASHTWPPRDLLRRLGVEPAMRWEFETADGRTIEREMGWTMSRWDGKVVPTFVVSGDEGSAALPGAHTMEGFLVARPIRSIAGSSA